jgi:hypothetical protein
LPTETRFGSEQVPARTLKIAPPSIRNWNVGCVVVGANSRMRSLQTSSRPRAVFVIVTVLTPFAITTGPSPVVSMNSPGWPGSWLRFSVTVTVEPIGKLPTMRHCVVAAAWMLNGTFWPLSPDAVK